MAIAPNTDRNSSSSLYALFVSSFPFIFIYARHSNKLVALSKYCLLGAVVLGNVSRDSPSTGVSLLRPLGNPALDGRCAVGREMLIEHRTVPVSFFGVGNVVAPFRLGVLHHLISNVELSVVLQAVNPAVADTVTKLLLLTPEDFVWQIGRNIGLFPSVECFPHDVLLDAVSSDHLLGGVNPM